MSHGAARAWVLKLFEELQLEHLELRDAYEITEEERQQDAERWAEFRVSSRNSFPAFWCCYDLCEGVQSATVF